MTVTGVQNAAIDDDLSTHRANHAVSISTITLQNFRNHPSLRLATSGQSVVLTGENGAGKTNILEAISLFAPGRGLRSASVTDLALCPMPHALCPPSSWSVVIDLQTPHTTHRLGTGSDPTNPQLARRVIHIDEKPASQNGLGEYITIAWATPDMDALWRESSQARRKFLDRLVYALSPNHWHHLNHLDKSRIERMRLLESGRMDDGWLLATEQSMAESSVQITQNRLSYIGLLNAEIHAFAPDFPPIRIDWQSPIPALIESGGMDGAIAALREQLKSTRRRDAQAGSTSVGAQRDDMAGWHGIKNRDIAACSTGEQKIAVLSVLLAHAQLLRHRQSRTPILLLDEMAAHLDTRHRAALAAVIADLGVQAWLSGADSSLFSDWKNGAEFFTVGSGKSIP